MATFSRCCLLAVLLALAAPASPPTVTTTSLTATPNPAVLGQFVTLSASVSSPSATGKMTFYDGVAVLGTSPVTSGVTSLFTALVPVGSRSLRAYYSGDATFSPSLSAAAPLTVTSYAENGFQPIVNYGVGTGPFCVTQGDFNGDGKPDLATANETTNDVSVLLGNSDGTFQTAVSYAVGIRPRFVTTGDFNGDGKTDLAVANVTDSTVSILLGNGDGTFLAAVSYPTVGSPLSIAVADFNGDGIADLAVTGGGSLSVSVLLGNGDGTFQATVSYPANGGASVAAGDFNGDGKTDLVVANGNPSNNVNILLGNGNGTFQAPVTYSAGNSPISVAVGDFNADGKSDLAVANFGGGANNVSVLVGNGDGTFQAAVNYGTGAQPRYVVVGDLNGDGRADLVTANAGSNNLSVLFGNGNGTFQAAVNYPGLSGPVSLAVGDFNFDGVSDLAVANNGSNTVSILSGIAVPDLTIRKTHAGNFALGETGAIYSIAVSNVGRGATVGTVTVSDTLPTGLTATSLAGPGWTCSIGTLTCTRSDSLGGFGNYPGIVLTVNVSASAPASVTNTATVSGGSQLNTTNDTSSDLTLIRAATAVTLAHVPNPALFGQPATLTASVTPSAATGLVTFYDGTSILGRAPLSGGQAILTTRSLAAGSRVLKAYYGGDVTYGPSSSPAVSHTVIAYRGSGFQPAVTYASGFSPFHVVAGDFNGDGKADLAAANEASNTVAIFIGNGDGTFQAAVPYSAGASPTSIAVADVNGDGKADLVVANFTNVVSILLGNGDGSFQVPVSYSAGNTPRAVVVADFNGDGKPDLAVANGNGSNVSVLLGNGDGTFQPAAGYLAGGNLFSIAVGDFNADGKADLVVSAINTNNVQVLLGNGDGTFQLAVGYNAGAKPFAVAVGDFNGDGRSDIAVANENSNDVSILLSNANGTFQAAVSYPAGTLAAYVAVGDFNGDGKSDLAVANFGSNNVSILLGNGNGTFRAAVNFATGANPYAIAVADLNGDSVPDLAVANEGSNDISILLGTPETDYLVGDGYPTNGDGARQFGDDGIDNFDLIATLRAVTLIPGAVPAACSDRFDAMDSFPVDGASRGGDGSLNNFDLIQSLRRVTSLDTTRPRRATRGLSCPAAAPLGRERPASGLTLEARGRRVAVYYTATEDRVLHGLSFALGADSGRLGFVPGQLDRPTLLDDALPGALAVAWLDDLRVRKGERILLGFVEMSEERPLRIFGGDTGRQ